MRDRLVSVIEAENSPQAGLEVEEAALMALVNLAGGDMRRALNGLQACAAAAATSSPSESSNNRIIHHIDEDLVYAVTAAPHPIDLDRILEALLNQTDLALCVESES